MKILNFSEKIKGILDPQYSSISYVLKFKNFEILIDAGGYKMEFPQKLSPGHTPGSVCFLWQKSFLFSGDTVFDKDFLSYG